jgi:2-C-methyl-D-erythritol 4-phosphate cytidylyltransferase
MFRYALLQRAWNRRAQDRLAAITDDASAIEMLGLRPRLVEGSPAISRSRWRRTPRWPNSS